MGNDPIGVVKIQKFDFRGRDVFVGMLGREKIQVPMPLVEGLKTIDTIKKERGADIKVISPALADYLLMGDNTFWGQVPEQSGRFWIEFGRFGFPTDLWIIHEQKNKPFGETVEFAVHKGKPPLKFKVPQRFQGAGTENTVLVVRGLRSGDLNTEDMVLNVEDETRFIQCRDFPPNMGGMYATDPETMMPLGRRYEDWEEERQAFWKKTEILRLRCPVTFEGFHPFIGFQSRWTAIDGVERQFIRMIKDIFDLVDIVVEIPEADLGKVTANK